MNDIESYKEVVQSDSLFNTKSSVEGGALNDFLFESTEEQPLSDCEKYQSLSDCVDHQLLSEDAGDGAVTGKQVENKQQVEAKKEISEKRQKLIERLEAVRLEDAAMLTRRNNALETLAEIYEYLEYSLKDIPIREGTEEELETQYKKILTEFHNKKEFWVKKTQIMNDKIKKKTEEFDHKTKELDELKRSLYELQLTNGVEMFDKTTGKKLTRKVVINILDTCETKNKMLHDQRLKFIKEDNKCKQLRKEIQEIKANTPFNIDEYERLLRENKEFEIMLEKHQKILSDDREEIKSMKKQILKIDEEIIELGKTKEKKDVMLKELKNQKKERINIKSHNQKVRIQQAKTHFVNPYEENTLLRKNYKQLTLKAEENQKRVAELTSLLEESRVTLKELRVTDAKLRAENEKCLQNKHKWI